MFERLREDIACIMERGAPAYAAVHFVYPSGPLVTAATGAIADPARPFTHGYEVYFEQATLHYEAPGPVRVYHQGRQETAAIESLDPVDVFARELSEALAAFADPARTTLLDAEPARDALAMCLEAKRQSGGIA